MRVIYFKCVSKFVNCVSAWVTGQMRENHAICVRVGNPVITFLSVTYLFSFSVNSTIIQTASPREVQQINE